jgi:uncharacterized 2Fe-2S/4Fe-4S cluster protein (DUF4445 family)
MQDLTVTASDDGKTENYAILTDHATSEQLPQSTSPQTKGEPSARYAIALDLGTTTIVAKLIDTTTGIEVASSAQLNAQITYGADVISRINASLDDASHLSEIVTTQIDQALSQMLKTHAIDPSLVESLVIAGNTTMSYILLNLPTRSLGSLPFTPAYSLASSYPYEDIFSTQTLSCDCFVLPFISAYVGGDLTAGLVSLRDEDDFILMDMGTNGELIFKRGDRLVCTSTAAGPAFEGGNIDCGSGSVQGAISSVHFENGEFILQTIGAAQPTGICGSGILDLMAVLVQEKFIDETGQLDDNIESQRIVLVEAAPGGQLKEVYFSQKDVRQFQLAKSAVRTGLEIIGEEMGGDLPSKIFMAGGFGQNLDPESAFAVGLLPQSFRGRVHPIGNSSLSGAVKICVNESARALATDFSVNGHEINLAAHKKFNDLFVDYMSFPQV